MLEITRNDYKQFLQSHPEVEIGETKIKLQQKWNISKFAPSTFTPETTTVWSFPDRGDWATHIGNYRGNWSPYIPRNLILRYTAPGDLVLDQMAGSGTTLVECKLMGRCAVGMDINPEAVVVARNRLDFSYVPLDAEYKVPQIRTYAGDARSLDLIDNESIDLIATHPPYASIIPYSRNRIEGDLSSVHSIAEFEQEMRAVAAECMRVLKPGKHCAVLIGDTRRSKHFVPITPRVLMSFLDAGFILREDIIKLQWKPEAGERVTKFRESMRWW